MKHRLLCPHCEQPANSLTLKYLSTTTMELGYACTNTECGHGFVVVAEASHTLSLPAEFNPAVKLPLGERITRASLLHALASLPTQPSTLT